jgi:TATA-box binding protein (TBP) (component of TFIID and TFIIIB)
VEGVFIEHQSRKNAFFNQATLTIKDVSTKSVKIFSNGKLQITGLSSYFECADVSSKVVSWLNQYAIAPELQLQSTIKIRTSRIAMINACLHLGYELRLTQLLAFLRTKYKSTHYNPEVYPAIRVKITPNSSCLVFKSGKVIISCGGGNALKGPAITTDETNHSCVDKVLDTYNELTKWISIYASTNPNIENISRKNEAHIDGYHCKDFYNACYI